MSNIHDSLPSPIARADPVCERFAVGRCGAGSDAERKGKPVIEVLSKPAGRMGIGDIEALISSGTPEGEEIEFKENLPAKGRDTDPWVGGKNKIGDRARDAILKETVAFANAHGGALLLGIEESAAKPPVAADLSPIPRCAELAERLKLTFRDCVEPQIPALEIFSVPIEGEAGVIVLRVGRSRLAPHRIKTTRICPIRRSDRCEEMTMREIQDMTLNVSRGLERLERRFEERAKRFQQEFECLRTPEDVWGIRLTAAPVQDDFRIDRLFHRGRIVAEFDDPWYEVVIRQNGDERQLEGLDTLFPEYWKPGLRLVRAESRRDGLVPDRNCYREIHGDGLVELGYVSVRTSTLSEQPWLLPADLPTYLLANLSMWADCIRKQMNTPSAEYALEVQFFSPGGKIEIWEHDQHDPQKFIDIRIYGRPALPSGSKLFPRYSLGDSDTIIDILSLFYRDFWNYIGRDVEAGKDTFAINGWSA